MAFLNKDERDALLNDIKDKGFGGIRFYVHNKDPKARLAFYRNAKGSGTWITRYVLETLGTQVTIYEKVDEDNKGWFSNRKYKIDTIVVEATANNRL